MLYSWAGQQENAENDPQFEAFHVREERSVCDYPRAAEMTHRKAAIGVVLSGCFDFRTPNGAATALPGSVIFGNPGQSFVARHPGHVGNRRLVAHFDPDFLEKVAASLEIDRTQFGAAAMPPGETASGLFARMQSLALNRSEEDACDLAVVALTFCDERHPMRPVSSSDRMRILPIVRYIETSYAKPCTIAQLAALSGLGRFQFMRAFKEVTGQSAAQFVIATRLRAAAQEIAHSKKPITEIAFDAGFNDISHFNNLFKMTHRCSPRQLRARLR